MTITYPPFFNPDLVYKFLNRSADEVCFRLIENRLYKLFILENKAIVCCITFLESELEISFAGNEPSVMEKAIIFPYIKEWLDLDTDLQVFYQLVEKDSILKDLIAQKRGLRLLKVPDFYEALCWSVIGQQINLKFAYQCKRALVEYAGKFTENEGVKLYAFPEPKEVLQISDAAFRNMKFSGQKVKYIRLISERFLLGKLDKKALLNMPFSEASAKLCSLKGIGHWSANYVLMRCLGFKEAYPIGDAALQNAVKKALNLPEKPDAALLYKLAENWKGWEAYATFYLWASL